MKHTPYQKSLLIALIKLRARTTAEIVQALAQLGWIGYHLIPEVVERSLQDLINA